MVQLAYAPQVPVRASPMKRAAAKSMSNQQPDSAQRAARKATVECVFASCAKKAAEWTREGIANYEDDISEGLTFRGPIFDAFSSAKSDSDTSEGELAAKYKILLNVLRRPLARDERLQLIAQWAWAETGLRPREFLGSVLASQLMEETRHRVQKLPTNDLYYAGLIVIWLPYIEQLFADVRATAHVHRQKNELLSYGHEEQALSIHLNRTWRSPVAFACEWLATRGVDMLKGREANAPSSVTLQNAYSRTFGDSAPHLLMCNFCEKPAIGDISAGDGSISYCKDHSPEKLPASSAEAWVDIHGRRCWRDESTIHCDSAPPSS
jgi:hypothetical protein